MNTGSSSFNGEHATTISGEGKIPSIENIMAVAQKNGIKQSKAREITEEVKAVVSDNLSEWIK